MLILYGIGVLAVGTTSTPLVDGNPACRHVQSATARLGRPPPFSTALEIGCSIASCLRRTAKAAASLFTRQVGPGKPGAAARALQINVIGELLSRAWI